jgi:hypothetical protein
VNIWRVLFSAIWRRVVRWKSTEVSEKHIVSVFRVKVKSYLLSACYKLVSCLAYSTMKIHRTCSSETSVGIQRTTRRDVPEDRTPANHRWENL